MFKELVFQILFGLLFMAIAQGIAYLTEPPFTVCVILGAAFTLFGMCTGEVLYHNLETKKEN